MNGESAEEPASSVTVDMFNELQLELMTLKAEVARLRSLLDEDAPDGSDD